MTKQKGDRAERKLVNYIEDELGYYAQRTTASGAATDRNRPDVIAIKAESEHPKIFFIESKARDRGYCRFSKSEIYDLEEASERAGAEAVVAIRPDLRSHDHIHCFTTDELKENDNSFAVTKSDLPGRSVKELLESDK